MGKAKRIIFISGTGRSGTHLIGRTISSHPEVSGRIEVASTFGLITKIATTQDFRPAWRMAILKKVLKLRLRKVLKGTDQIILEKSHPSLWLVDFLIREFDCKFIFVYRELEPTVSSMLEHHGVLSWYKSLPLDRPNRFLGITPANAAGFAKLSLEEQCALRWQSHYREIFRLHEKYPEHTLPIQYDAFLVDPEPLLARIAEFIGIANTFEAEQFKTDSLDKWKQKLDDAQLARMRGVVG